MALYRKEKLRVGRRFGRNREIQGLVKAGWSAKRKSREHNLSYSWAKKLVRRIKQGESMDMYFKSGRKRKTTPREDRHLVRQAKMERPQDEDCPRVTDLAEELKHHSGSSISVRTVLHRLRDANLRKNVKTRKPFVNTRNQAIRLKFARDHLNWTVEQWKKVLWTGESPYVLRCMIRQYVWRTPGERFKRRCMQGTVKHQKKIQVWGGFSWNVVGRIKRVIGKMDAVMYKQILIHQMRPSGRQLIGEDFILAQDNDPKHTLRLCM